MRNKEFAVLEAPSILGLFPGGVQKLPEALLDAGLAEQLSARDCGRVEPLPYNSTRDPETLLLNPHGIAEYAITLADNVCPLLDEGIFPIVLGGDCSILLGNLLALRRRGRYGLIFLDGHADFYQPEAEPSGEAASMELALATARGPAVVANIEGRGPLVREQDVVAMGRRDQAETEAFGSQRIEDSGIKVIDFAAIRAMGAARAAAVAAAHLSHVDGYWIHLDADVLDDSIMPAVDYRMKGGLTWDELSLILQSICIGKRAIGIDITIFNPDMDEDGSIARAFVDALVRSLN